MDTETKKRLKELSRELCHLKYEEIEARLESFTTEELIELMNSKSCRVGDSAFSLLWRRKNYEPVVDAILNNRLTHRDAKVRGTNFLLCDGRSDAQAVAAYLHYLSDTNDDVVDNALWAIVLCQNRSHLSLLRERRDSLDPENPLNARFDDAIRAIEKKNPFIYSPFYGDEQAEQLWGIKNARRKREAAIKAFEKKNE